MRGPRACLGLGIVHRYVRPVGGYRRQRGRRGSQSCRSITRAAGRWLKQDSAGTPFPARFVEARQTERRRNGAHDHCPAAVHVIEFLPSHPTATRGRKRSGTVRANAVAPFAVGEERSPSRGFSPLRSPAFRPAGRPSFLAVKHNAPRYATGHDCSAKGHKRCR